MSEPHVAAKPSRCCRRLSNFLMGGVSFAAADFIDRDWFEPITGKINVEWLTAEEIAERQKRLRQAGAEEFRMVDGAFKEVGK